MIDMKKPTQHGMDSGAPLFSEAQLHHIYNDSTNRYVDCTFSDTIDAEEVPKKYQGQW